MTAGNARLRLGMLGETHQLALQVAEVSCATPETALGSVFQRGVRFLQASGDLRPIRGGANPEALELLNRTRQELLALDTQYPVTKYVTLILTQRLEELETTCLALADQHLAARAEIVACRREEERLKRELTKLGLPTVPLPEHGDLQEVEVNRRSKRREMYEELLEGATTVDAELEVEPTTLETAEHLAAARGWTAEWAEHAPLVVFTQGLSAALREREAHGIDLDDDASVERAQQGARRQVTELEGRYATLRLRLFELRQNNRILQWRITAFRIEAEGMRNRLELFGRDRIRLEEQLAAAQIRDAAPNGSRGSTAKKDWRGRFRRLFRAS